MISASSKILLADVSNLQKYNACGCLPQYEHDPQGFLQDFKYIYICFGHSAVISEWMSSDHTACTASPQTYICLAGRICSNIYKICIITQSPNWHCLCCSAPTQNTEYCKICSPTAWLRSTAVYCNWQQPTISVCALYHFITRPNFPVQTSACLVCSNPKQACLVPHCKYIHNKTYYLQACPKTDDSITIYIHVLAAENLRGVSPLFVLSTELKSQYSSTPTI